MSSGNLQPNDSGERPSVIPPEAPTSPELDALTEPIRAGEAALAVSRALNAHVESYARLEAVVMAVARQLDAQALK